MIAACPVCRTKRRMEEVKNGNGTLWMMPEHISWQAFVAEDGKTWLRPGRCSGSFLALSEKELLEREMIPDKEEIEQ